MSSQSKCRWSSDGSELPSVELHAKVKHRVAEAYIRNWTETLTGHGAHGVKTVTLVDGFSGGGMYRDGDQLWEGSPIRMIRMVEEGLSIVRQRKPWHELDVEYIFIDSKKAHTQCLELQLRNVGFGNYLDTGKCKIIKGRFDEKLEFCLNRVRERRGFSFFFLDPFGLDVSPAIVREILALGRSEVLFTHMLSGLVRILKRRDEEQYRNFFRNFEADDYYLGIADQEDFLVRQAYLRNEGLKLFRTEGGARYAHTFALMSNPKTVLYYLIHASSNPTALSVMRDTTWLQNNLDFQFHYGVYGLGYRKIDDIADSLAIFNVDQRNVNFCIDKLSEQIAQFIFEKGDISFEELYLATVQENPATQGLYVNAINFLQDEGELVAVRNENSRRGRRITRIQRDDIIKRANYKQIILLTNPGVTGTGVSKRANSKRRKVENVVIGNQLQLFE
jgi:three-Cys-motif partner protein